MDKVQLKAFIQHIFPIPENIVAEITGIFKEKQLSKNEFFLKAGRTSDEYLFLERGFLRAFTHDLEGNEVTTNFYNSNQVVFEVASFFQRLPSKENIQALADGKGWYITYEELNGLFHAIPQFREFGRAVLVKGFVALKERMLSMISDTADERYARLLKRSPEIFQHAPLKHIASYLGVTDTSLSRIRKAMSREP